MRKAFLALVVLIAISTVVYAENETAPVDPCANVQCNSPPATACEGGSVKTYSSAGTCSGGTCSYSSSLTSCPNGCENGQCKANFCDTASCAPASRTCPDGFTASCTNTCDRTTQACSTCEPSCAGHETAPTSNGTSGGSGGGGGEGSSNTSGSGGTSSDACATMTCNTPPANTCNDNFVRIFSSPGACSNGQCSYPETGYACQNGCSNGACVSGTGGSGGTTDVSCTDSDGGKNYFSRGTAESRRSSQDVQVLTDGCTSSSTLAEQYCASDGLRTDYYTCPGACSDGACVEGGTATNGTGSGGGGTTGQHCESRQTLGVDGSGRCSSFPSTCLPPGWRVVESCPTEVQCDNDNVCDKGEEYGCNDCIGADCPIKKQCPDGSSVRCERTERGCNCEPCRLEEIPDDCRQETDQSGLIRVVCDRQQECPPVPQEVRLKCADEGGTPRFNKDHRGCNVFQCDFGGEKGSSPVFASRANCPSPDAVIASLEKCRDLGLPGVIGFEGGCKIGKCQQREERHECPNPTEPEKMEMEKKCREEGQQLVFQFDGQCNQPKCGQRRGSQCERDLPKEAYDRCADGGGQLVVRRSQDGCVSYSNCIRRGNAEESLVDDIDEIPDTTELLSIAFKLEELKLEFDKLSAKTNDIAEYYKSTGSSEEKRFRRVSDMFSSAKDKVDEVKTKLKDRARDIDKDDVLEIKQDLRYLKDVVLKDILFMMLGSGEEIEEIKSGSVKSCGTDESCFDRGFRVCQPLTFRPDGREGPVVEVTGLDGDACVMEVKMEAGQGPPGGPYSMTCKIQKYTLGVSNPETDIFPYCSGNLLDMIKKYGNGPPGVPGKCSGDECKDYCGRGPTEAKECLQYMSDVLPPEAKQHLTALAEGKSPGGFGFGGRDESGDDFGEGEFRDDFGGDDFNQGEFQDDFSGGGEFEGEFNEEFGGQQLCPDGDCDDFEQRTGACPQDCGGSSASGGGGGEFENEFEGGFESGSSSGGGGGSGECSGCLNNGICDQGECSDCGDCRRR